MVSPIATTLAKTKKFIESYGDFIIFPHVKADGDALGSAVALKLVLEKLGKSALIFSEDELPHNLKDFFKGTLTDSDPLKRPQAVISVDTADEGRLPRGYYPYRNLPLLNIDHHATNSLYGDVNLVYGGLSSTGELLGILIDELGVHFDKEIASALYIALVTDTNRFMYPSSTSASLRLAARLYEAGADFEKIHRAIYGEKPIEVLRLQAIATEKLEFLTDNLVYCRLIREDFSLAGFHETDDIITMLRDIKGVDIAALVYDYENKQKLSLRSKGPQNVDELAAYFGGGGHKKAAGSDISPDQLDLLRSKLRKLSHVG